MTANTLAIDGDDLSDLIVDIERGFGIRLGRDLRHIVTVGDLHRAIMAKVPEERGHGCPTSSTFYRVRRALTPFGMEADARPDLPLAGAMRVSPKYARAYLETAIGLEVPHVVLGWTGCFALVLGPVIGGACGIWLSAWLVLPVVILTWAIGMKADAGSYKGEWATLGQLSRAIAAHNHARLAAEGARHSSRSVWNALLTLLEPWGTPRDRIGPDSRLCQPLKLWKCHVPAI